MAKMCYISIPNIIRVVSMFVEMLHYPGTIIYKLLGNNKGTRFG